MIGIIKKLRQNITGKCVFMEGCIRYRENSVTCNKEAGAYCGQYRILMENHDAM